MTTLVESLRMEANCAAAAAQGVDASWASAMGVLAAKFHAAADRIEELEAGAPVTFGHEGAREYIKRARDHLTSIDDTALEGDDAVQLEQAFEALDGAKNCLAHTVPK